MSAMSEVFLVSEVSDGCGDDGVRDEWAVG